VHGGQLITGATVTAIDGHCVRYQLADGQTAESQADSVVLAIGAQPNTYLLDELTRAGLNATSIGDCQSIGYIEGAISAGHKAGREA
jgi:2,4-dienoyl-CoA reductase (NADPH2)